MGESVILEYIFFWAKQGGGDLARHFDLQPISAKKGGGLSMNSTVLHNSSLDSMKHPAKKPHDPYRGPSEQ